MESKAMPTVTDHFIEFYKDHAFKEYQEYPSIADIKEFTTDPYFIASMKSMHEYAVLFAKYHREHQIEAIKENIKEPAYSLNVHPCNFDKAIENAYSEDLIK